MILYQLGVAAKALPKWSADKDWVMFTVVMFSVWKNMGYYMVIYLAGLQGINSELYEACSLDGANAWQRFRYITWPQLQPTTFFVTIILTINCFKVYDIVYMLAGGSTGVLNESAIVLVYHIYEEAFRNWNLGYDKRGGDGAVCHCSGHYPGTVPWGKEICQLRRSPKMKIKNTKTRAMRVFLYMVLVFLAFVMLVPFAWMLSASFKLDKDVFIFPIQWIPEHPRWQNYVDIWTRIPLLRFVINTVKLTLIVTFFTAFDQQLLQALAAFPNFSFKGKTPCF